MTAQTKTITEEIAEALCIDDDSILVETGNYSSGFWHNELKIDLEALRDDNICSAYSVVTDIHDTAGTTFRAYYGIDRYAKLPSGVAPDAIIAFCEDIYNRREELTAGFNVEYVNGNEVARWYDEDGDLWPDSPAATFWDEKFLDDVRDLPARNVYDLSYIDNYPFVLEALESDLSDDMPRHEVRQVVEEAYENDDDTIFTGHEQFVDRYMEERGEN